LQILYEVYRYLFRQVKAEKVYSRRNKRSSKTQEQVPISFERWRNESKEGPTCQNYSEDFLVEPNLI